MENMLKKRSIPELAIGLFIGFIACVMLYAYSVVLDHGLAYAYMIVNVVLATIPLLLSWRIVAILKRKRWSAWEPLLLSFVWIIFLPNSFYMVSDYIHLQGMSNRTILFNSIMFSGFIFLAMFMGLMSLYQIHTELRKRISPRLAALVIALLIAGCCFAIYLGRDLRWNSWDVIINPAGLLFDISNLILKPQTYPDMGRTMAGFFILIGSMYIVAWRSGRTMWHRGVNDLAAHIRKRQNG